jgi:hypothetical protein
MSNNDIINKNKTKKKRCSPLLTFQTRDLSHPTRSTIHEKNYEIQSLENEMLKDEIENKI